jgi:hypothetical protein
MGRRWRNSGWTRATNLSAGSARRAAGQRAGGGAQSQSLQHLQRILEKTDTRKIDIVVLSVRQVTQAASGEHPLDAGQIFSDDETNVFTTSSRWRRRPASTWN